MKMVKKEINNISQANRCQSRLAKLTNKKYLFLSFSHFDPSYYLLLANHSSSFFLVY
jgi:hypothetical protein